MENFTAHLESAVKMIAFNENGGILQPAWNYLRSNYGHIMRSPLFPPFFALSIDYIWVIVFTSKLFYDLIT
jgi:hypothetical protein